ncbi:DsbA family protein [Propionivibrio dicarboxylicus]|uniref:Protein-disulfide isomerase n=1 Tax=Propionivibrio dicarboxylicus TaxID=83767 RepID=A0A1G7YHT0_9RHOO|nr:thioredoxin domain-containing protein [Propionivibrio dicarboxylicus]SDG95785.1 Protein-disulfide isomerase [Propionivibrio dicarboxylicus]
MKQKTVFIASAIALLLAFVAGVLFYQNQQEKAANEKAEANRAILTRMHSPTLGSANAPVVIVEFLDPACETCGAFYPRVKKMMAEHPDRIRLVLRHAPFHRGSDNVVAALEAARRQGKFWPALEILLANQSDWAQNHTANIDRAWKYLERVGLNMEQLALDMRSPEIANVITQDLADAKALGVTMTPEYFVNGKPLPSFGFEQLKDLVDKALAETRGR